MVIEGLMGSAWAAYTYNQGRFQFDSGAYGVAYRMFEPFATYFRSETTGFPSKIAVKQHVKGQLMYRSAADVGASDDEHADPAMEPFSRGSYPQLVALTW